MARIASLEWFQAQAKWEMSVKFVVSVEPSAPVYAVAWLKTAKNVVIGFALPESIDNTALISAPSGMKYKGLTKYFRLVPGQALPTDIDEWANVSFEHVVSEQSEQ